MAKTRQAKTQHPGDITIPILDVVVDRRNFLLYAAGTVGAVAGTEAAAQFTSQIGPVSYIAGGLGTLFRWMSGKSQQVAQYNQTQALPNQTVTTTTQTTDFQRFAESYPTLSKGFTESNYQSAIRTLTKELLDDTDLHETLNAKIRQEDFKLFDYEKGPRASRTDPAVDRLRQRHYELMADAAEKSPIAVPLRTSQSKKLYPDENDRSAIYTGIWDLQGIDYSDPGNKVSYSLEDVKKKLESLPSWFELYTKFENDPIEHERSLNEYGWEGWLSDRSHNGWGNTVAEFRKIDGVLSKDAEFGSKWMKMKSIYGSSRYHSGDVAPGFRFGGEVGMYKSLSSVFKSFGVPTSFTRATPVDGATISEWANPIYTRLFDNIKQVVPDVMRLSGSRISLIGSSKSGMAADGANHLTERPSYSW